MQCDQIIFNLEYGKNNSELFQSNFFLTAILFSLYIL